MSLTVIFQVLQQQLIKAEREKILQQFQSGNLPTESLIPAASLFEDEDEIDEDDIGGVVARRLRAAAAAQQKQQHQQMRGGA